PEFQAIRNADESAKMADAVAAKKAALATPAAPAAPVAPPAAPPVAANRAAAVPSSPPPSAPALPSAAVPAPAPAPRPDAASPTAINGVYTGQFQRPEGNSKLKMLIKSTDDGSLTALFTFDPPNRRLGPSLTYKLTGHYDATAHDQWGNKIEPFQFTAIEPMGTGAQKALEASKAQTARLGVASPDSIQGMLIQTVPGSGESYVARFTATKDRTQPADLDQTLVAQADATTAPGAPVAR